MAEWDKSKVECLVTWITLVDLGQTRKGGLAAGCVKMEDLAFWNPHDSLAIRKSKARTIAIQCDNIFRRYWGAKYETGKNRTKTINATTRIFTNGIKTIADLAEANNNNYLYHGE